MIFQILLIKIMKEKFTYIIFTLLLIAASVLKSYSQSYFNGKDILPPKPSAGRVDSVISNLIYVRLQPDIEFHEIRFLLEKYNARVIKPLLEIKNQLYKKSSDDISRSDAASGEEKLRRTYLVEYNADLEPEYICGKLESACSMVDCAEPFYLPLPIGEFIPNDSLVPQQEYLRTIHAFEAFDLFKGDTSIAVGISDSGVLQDHEDLVNSIWKNWDEIPNNGVDDDGNGFIDDFRGVNFTWQDDTTDPGNTYHKTSAHGTAVAGLTCAATDNNSGIASVGFNCRLFPMKTTPNFGRGMLYGYESILYAVDNNLPVINLSWGNYYYSCIRESIVRYAMQNDVAVVAGAGNHGNTAHFYPAAYYGVLGAGVTQSDDKAGGESALGSFVDIMTPGNGAYTTLNDSTYARFSQTSAASPIAAGAVAYVRALHPEFNAWEANEFTRLCSDNIEDKNPSKKGLIPGRLNLYKAATLDPDMLTSLRPLQTRTWYPSNINGTRISVGDTVDIKLMTESFFSDPRKADITMSIVGDSLNSIEILDSTVDPEEYQSQDSLSNSLFGIKDCRIKINKLTDDIPFLRFNIKTKVHSDYFMIPIGTSRSFTTFSNDKLTFSMIDNGRIGYADPPVNNIGEGFRFNYNCSVIFGSGVIVTENNQRVVDNTRNEERGYNNHFKIEKRYTGNESNIGIVNDSAAPENKRIGIRVKTNVFLPEDAAFTKLNLDLENISGTTLKDISAGYFIDWDIGEHADSNSFLLFPDGVPEEMKDLPVAAAYMSGKSDKPFVGTAVFSKNYDAEPQLSSMTSEMTVDSNGFSDIEKLNLMNEGVKSKVIRNDDIAGIIGMKFPGELPACASREYNICLCAAENFNDMVTAMHDCIKSWLSDVEDKFETGNIKLYPNPAEAQVILFNPNYEIIEKIYIFDTFGGKISQIVLKGNEKLKKEIKIDVAKLSTGIYFVLIKTKNNIKTLPLTIMR